MERRTIQTLVGEVPVWSDFDRHDAKRPLVLVIRGALPGQHDLEWLAPAGADIAFLHLPGFYVPVLVNNSIGVMIHAFDAVIASAFPDRRIVVLGSSSGALLAAGLRAPGIVGRVLIEPFFSTGELWALANLLRALLSKDLTEMWQWMWDVLGVSPTTQENRDYRHLLIGDVPLSAVVGDLPLMPPRDLPQLPSLTGDDDRNLLRSLGADVTVASGGHGVPNTDRPAVSRALEAMLQRVG
ncbi:MAG: alpha/beta hydrolase [Phenylobacterium sp.]